MIYIIRHGQTELNNKMLMQGRSDHPLNGTGEAQAKAAAERLAARGITIDRVYSSPLERAVNTAKIMVPSAEPVIDGRLTEMDYGPYEGMDLKDPAPEVMEFFMDFANVPAPEGMEPLPEVVSRLGSFLEDIKEEAEEHDILISTHAIAMKGALEYLTPESKGGYWSRNIGNCEIYTADVRNGSFTVPVQLRDGVPAVCISKYNSDEHIGRIRETCRKYGYDISFYRDASEAEGNVSDAEVAFCSDTAALPMMNDLRWCQADSAGVENYLKTGMFDDGSVVLTNSSGAFGLSIAEHIIMVSLMLMRRMPDYLEMTSKGQWKHNLPIRSIEGSNIAFVGTGNLGSTAAKKFKALGAERVIGFSLSGRAREPFDEVHRLSEFEKYIGEPDIVVLCLPGTAETKNIIDEEKISAMPESAYLINVGRGSTLDQDALAAALNKERLAGAALDVTVPEPLPPDHPLWTARNCIITPHSSGDMGLQHSVNNTVEIFCENLKRYAMGEPLVNVVDPAAGY